MKKYLNFHLIVLSILLCLFLRCSEEQPKAKSGEKEDELTIIANKLTAVALDAGKIIFDLFSGAPMDATTKESDLELLTVADTTSENFIFEQLSKAFPNSSFLMEEGHNVESDTPERFIVDPLDGTTNFANGVPHFAVSIAYEKNGQIMVGVVYDPIREEMFVAKLNDGATLNGVPIHVSGETQLKNALLETGFRPGRKRPTELEQLRGVF